MKITPKYITFNDTKDKTEYLTETHKAYLFRFPYYLLSTNVSKELWVPKSVCTYDLYNENLKLEKWWAKSNGIRTKQIEKPQSEPKSKYPKGSGKETNPLL